MKTKFNWITQRAALFVATAVITSIGASMATAQPADGRPRGERPAGDRPNMAARGGVALDEKQREAFRAAMQKNADQMRALDEKLRAAQKELVQAAIAEKTDEKTLREKSDAVAKVQGEMTLLRARAFSAVAPSLTAEQREQLENSRFGAAMLLGGGMGGFGGGEGVRGDAPRAREGQAAPNRPRREGGDRPGRRGGE